TGRVIDRPRGPLVGRDARLRAPWRRAIDARSDPRSAAGGLVQRPDGLAARLAVLGHLVGEFLGPELDRAVTRVHEDGIALGVLAGEDLLRERVQDQPLDRAADRPRTVRRVIALLGDEGLRRGRE